MILRISFCGKDHTAICAGFHDNVGLRDFPAIRHIETTFAPDERITREKLATFFYRYAEFCGCDVSPRANLGAYSDLSVVSS